MAKKKLEAAKPEEKKPEAAKSDQVDLVAPSRRTEPAAELKKSHPKFQKFRKGKE